VVKKEEKNSSKSISFGDVQIREFNRIVGDHPDVKVGPPVSLSWEYGEQPAVSVDEYEAERSMLRKGVRRMSSITRKNMLHNVFGISEEEIRSAEKEIQRIRKQREQSIKQGKVSARVESGVNRVKRKLSKLVNPEMMLQGLSATAGMMAIQVR
jgi:hypothetical protein